MSATGFWAVVAGLAVGTFLIRFSFVWMPRGMQGHREPLERVIECALVSGL